LLLLSRADWFIGLSKQFLSLKEAKVLVLAGEEHSSLESLAIAAANSG
jgi:hypothetical protein